MSIRYKCRMIQLTDEQWERIRNHFPEEHIPDGGAAVVRDEPDLVTRLGFLQNATGGILDPFSSFLALRGMKTLPLRMERRADDLIDDIERALSIL